MAIGDFDAKLRPELEALLEPGEELEGVIYGVDFLKRCP